MGILIAFFIAALILIGTITATSKPTPQQHHITGGEWEAVPLDDPGCHNCHCFKFNDCRMSLRWDAQTQTGEDCSVDGVVFRRLG